MEGSEKPSGGSGGVWMKTRVKGIVNAPHMILEYASPKRERTDARQRPDPGREKERMKELLAPLVKEAVRRQLKEQQDYYRSRPSLAARQMEQIFGGANIEKVLAPAVSLRVYERIEERIRHEWIRKGR